MESRYIVLTAPGKAECRAEEIDTALAGDEFLIRNRVSLISAGTELSRVFAIKKGFSYPVYPGYASVGEIVAIGASVEGFEPGDRVFHSGAHRSLSKVTNDRVTQGLKVIKLDGDADPAADSLCAYGLIALNGVHAADVQLGDTLAVFGLGPIGLCAAMLYKERGARVIALDPVKKRCEIARALGIEEVFGCAPDEQIEAVVSATGGRGADISVDVTGLSPAILNAILSTGKHGQVILLGTPRAGYTADITPCFNHLHMKMITLKGAFNELNPYTKREGSRFYVENDFAYWRGFARRHPELGRMITQRVRPEEIESAYHGLYYDKENYVCTVIVWDD